jgi:hypothetical protein
MTCSRKKTWSRHVTHVGEKRNFYWVLVGVMKGIDYLEDLRFGGNYNIKMYF